MRKLPGRHISEIGKQYLKARPVTFFSTGIKELDDFTGGLPTGELTLIAARPNIGKTSLMMQFVENIAIHHKMPVGIFSIEMCGRSLMNRMIAARTGLNSIALRKGELTDKQRKTRDNALADIVKLPLYVDDSSAATVQYIRRASIDWIKAGIRILALDYIQLMTAGKASSTDLRASFIGDCIRTLKQLARDHDVLFLVLSQLNRESAKANRAPTVADLKDSGELEQVADNILLIHKNGEGQDIVYDLLLEKWRNGPSGIVSTQFNAARTRFESVKEEKKGIL